MRSDSPAYDTLLAFTLSILDAFPVSSPSLFVSHQKSAINKRVMKHVDFLIVGQGLAGSLLAWSLLKNGKKIHILDNRTSSASRVAAGLINPVTGKRLAMSEGTENQLKAANECYKELADHFHQVFFHKKPQLRLLQTHAEAEAAEKRLRQENYQVFIKGIDHSQEQLLAPFGCLQQTQTGQVMIAPLLDALKICFIEKGCYSEESVNFDHINSLESINTQTVKAEQVIFCEGAHINSNPYFSWLPLKPVKGEILTIMDHDHAFPSITKTHILNYGNWLIPMGSGAYRLGATFDRESQELVPTESARHSLCTRLRQTLPDIKQFGITDQLVGLRPTTHDRAPFLGRHPHFSHLNVFNGFGAKGSMQIPYYADCMTAFLLDQKPLPADVSIERIPL